MLTGKVKFFNKTKGFGFIKSDDGEDIFVHVTGLTEPINQDDDVSFDTIDGKKGLNAINVKVIDKD